MVRNLRFFWRSFQHPARGWRAARSTDLHKSDALTAGVRVSGNYSYSYRGRHRPQADSVTNTGRRRRRSARVRMGPSAYRLRGTDVALQHRDDHAGQTISANPSGTSVPSRHPTAASALHFSFRKVGNWQVADYGTFSLKRMAAAEAVSTHSLRARQQSVREARQRFREHRRAGVVIDNGVGSQPASGSFLSIRCRRLPTL